MPRRIPLLLLLGLLLSACSHVSHAYTTQTPVTTLPAATAPAPSPVPAPEPITFTGTGFDLHTAGRVGQATFDATWAGVLDTLNHYLDAAVLTPLRTGGPAGDLTPFFTPFAVGRVMGDGPDRAAFIDEGLPPTFDVRRDAAVAALSALAGSDGTVSVAVAKIDLRLIGHIAGDPVTVVRTGELVLLPEGGAWRIDAYDLRVTRTVAENSTTTTVRA
jgi:hypothetical protein